MTSKLEALERLANLRDRGILSDDEFAAEKTIVLGTGAVTVVETKVAPEAIQPIAPAPTAPPKPKMTYAERREANQAAEEKVWSLAPITNIGQATFLLSCGWSAFWFVTADGSIDVVRNFWTAMSGGVVDPAVTNREALVTSVIGFAIYTAITLVTAFLAVKRGSRIAAGFLIFLALFELILAAAARWDDSKTLRNAAFLICVPAIGLALQCLRATIALRKMSKT